MSELLDSLIADIDNRVRAKDPTAVERAAQLAEQYPNDQRVWYSLAYAHSGNDDLDGAVLAMNRLAAVAAPEPAMFFTRGSYEHERGNLEAALADFTAGIELSKQLQYEYYLESLYFSRADVLVALGRKTEALADLAHLPDDFRTWTTTLRTKYDLLADCEGQRRPWKEAVTREQLDSAIEDIYNRTCTEALEGLEQAEKLAKQYPDEPEVWRALAYARSMNGDRDGAVAAMNRMMDITGPNPRVFFIRAHYEQSRGNLEAALADLNQVFALEKQEADVHEDDMQALYFSRADVLVGLGRKAEALADLAHVPDGYMKPTTRLRTKADILADCEG